MPVLTFTLQALPKEHEGTFILYRLYLEIPRHHGTTRSETLVIVNHLKQYDFRRMLLPTIPFPIDKVKEMVGVDTMTP